ncbi:DUF4080 domain-containing protein [Verrucomicrobiota bacterium]
MDIVLTTFNARYSHTAFGLRYLKVNLRDLEERSRLLEFELSSQPRRAAELILAENPRIVAMSVYIWNLELCTATVQILKKVRPELPIVLGGPEVSYNAENLPIVQLADYITCGEGETVTYELCRDILNDNPPTQKFLQKHVDLETLELPYRLYSDTDVQNRVLYCETTRGCPFQCEYCMSSIDNSVRYFDLDKLLPEFENLIERGALHFKFVDRTFNLDLDHAEKVIRFFLERYRPGMMLHFEMIPERLPARLKALIEESPSAFYQFEIGIQTLNSDVADRIKRPLNLEKIEQNMRWLSTQKSVHMHADLIAGLPGEDLDSFAAGFDQLLKMGPEEIQLGILKKLRGTGIARHDHDWEMAYNPNPPYEILQNKLIPFAEMQRIQRFARYWNLTVNNGNFPNSAPLIWKNNDSVFGAFMEYSDWLFETTQTTGGIALNRLTKLLFGYLKDVKGFPADQAAESVARDWLRGKRSDLPPFLRPYKLNIAELQPQTRSDKTGLDRQQRHLDH